MKLKFLNVAVIAAASAVLGNAAQAEDLVVGIFGGSFAEASKSCHIDEFEKSTGAHVSMKLGSSSQFAAALRASAGNSGFDVVYVDNSLATQLKAEGLLETIDVAKLKNAKDLAPIALDKDSQYVVFQTAGTVIVYDKTQVKNPPTSWADLSKPEFAGRLAIGDISGTAGVQLLIALSRLHGGDLQNMDPGFKAAHDLAQDSVTLYTQADQIVSLFERKEISVAAWYPDRAGSAIDKGLPLGVVYPKEGAIGILPALAIPRGAKSPELALKYIDEVLSKKGQTCFAETKYAGPVNTQVQLSEKAAAIVPYKATFDSLYFPDPTKVAQSLPAWTKRWQREVAR